LRFLPEEMFGPQFAPVNVGPVLTKKGFAVVKMKTGRYLVGYKLRPEVCDPEDVESAGEEHVEEKEKKVVVANTVVFSETTTTTEDGEEETSATAVRVSVVEEKNGTIEHFLFASTTSTTAGKDNTTIDLGRI
jgi:hypothetical protein